MKVEALLELIKSRRSIMPPQYDGEEITEQELNMILESANWAPTHKRTEPSRFIILQGKALNRFSEFMLSQYDENTAPENRSERKIEQIREKCLKSDKIILICVKYSGKVPDWEEVASVSAGVQNMWLMCTALGIGSYWSTPAAIQKMDEFSEMEEDEKCIGIFYMGKFNRELPKGNRGPIEEKTKFIHH
jgi:nitroreductase